MFSPYQLTVVKTGKGEYQVSYYHKASPANFPDLAGVINYLTGLHYDALDDFKEILRNPTFVDVPAAEQTAVRNVSGLLLRILELEKRAAADSR